MIGNPVPTKYSILPGIANGLMLELYSGAAINNKNLFTSTNGYTFLISSETIDSSSIGGKIKNNVN